MKKIIFFLFIAVSSIGKSQTVTIGKQIWSSKNLDVEYFRNGDPIPQAKTCEEWKLASENKKPIWCYYFFDPNNGKLYGKLYNWYAVNDPRGLAPIGWHIPEYSEWKQLIDYLGGTQEFKEWAELGTAEDLRAALIAFEKDGLYEHCVILKELLIEKQKQ
jgi:uncharacterized protein (TIGR02145 family)